MKINPRHGSAKIQTGRWLAYAGAASATALIAAPRTDAAIHYSGPVNKAFPAQTDTTASFQLDQPDDFFVLQHTDFIGLGGAFFRVEAVRGGDFRGVGGLDSAYVTKIGTGRYISQGNFTKEVYSYGTLVKYGGGPGAKWNARGIGFIGFRFNNGAGVQYGWARIHMGGLNKNSAFKLLDYAYADPGEPLKAGQRDSSAAEAASEGSLGLLALGGAGVTLWRRRRRCGVEEA
jgi:hypothetical protein